MYEVNGNKRKAEKKEKQMGKKKKGVLREKWNNQWRKLQERGYEVVEKGPTLEKKMSQISTEGQQRYGYRNIQGRARRRKI